MPTIPCDTVQEYEVPPGVTAVSIEAVSTDSQNDAVGDIENEATLVHAETSVAGAVLGFGRSPARRFSRSR